MHSIAVDVLFTVVISSLLFIPAGSQGKSYCRVYPYRRTPAPPVLDSWKHLAVAVIFPCIRPIVSVGK